MDYRVSHVSDIDLENATLCLILHGLQEFKLGISTQQEFDKLKEQINILLSNGNPFSTSFYRDIVDFINASFTDNELIAVWDIQKHLEKCYPLIQNSMKNTVHSILQFNDLYLRLMPLDKLIEMMLVSYKERKVREELEKQLKSDSIEVDNIKIFFDSIDISDSGIQKRLESKVKKYQESKTASERAIIKRNLKKEGLTPFKINELIGESVPPIEPPKVTSINDFLLKDFGDSNWIYPGIIPANVVTLITGQAGSGKTGFAYSLLFSYLAGADFLDEQPSVLVKNPKKRGLIINADQTPLDAQEMLSSSPMALKNRHKCDIIESGWTLFHILQLEMLIQQVGYTFIVIDSYKAIHNHLGGWDENSSTASLGLQELQRIASTYEVNIILIHHAGHNERKRGHQSRGHSSIADTASCVLSLTAAQMDRNKGDHNQYTRYLDISKVRNAENSQLTIKFNPITYQYDLHKNGTAQKMLQIATLANKILPDFDKCPGKISVGYFLGKLGSNNEQRTIVYKAIRKLEMRGLIKKEMDANDLSTIYYSRVIPKELTANETGF